MRRPIHSTHLSELLAGGLALLFVLFQGWTADYGTRINDLPYIRDYKVPQSVLAGSALERSFVVGAPSEESLDKEMLRFKLYSIDADEMMNIMALARIAPARGQFDPHFYQYGGAWLYPLGAWYAALNRLGMIHVGGGLAAMMAQPRRMDAVYFYGRLFVILATAVAGLLLFVALRDVTDRPSALAGMTLFLICPATICFSQTMKPHWYALVFVNAALLVLVRSFVRQRLMVQEELVLAASLGLAVGSALSFGSFAVFVWFALLFMVYRREAPWPALFRVPAVALAVFAATNPYLIADFLAAQHEAEKTAAWFSPSLNVASLGDFGWSSLLPGLGIPLTVVLVVVCVRELARPTFLGARAFAAGVVISFVFVAALTANLSNWPINYRYISYVFPAAILLVFASRQRLSNWLIVAAILATALEAFPLKLAYVDENDLAYGTRLRAAQWIDENVLPGTAVCTATATPAPFSAPPFDFANYAINGPNCEIIVRVERYEVDHRTPAGYSVVRRFKPRLSVDWFALIFGHINPLITIYRRT